MKKQLIEDTFTVPDFNKAQKAQKAPISISEKNPNLSTEYISKPKTEKRINLTTYEIEESSVDISEEEDVRKSMEIWEEELAESGQVELKAAVEEFYQNWQESVILRLGEKINRKDEKQAEEEKNRFLNQVESEERTVEEVVDKVVGKSVYTTYTQMYADLTRPGYQS